ncbi:uncharacterized protein LOC141575847 [Camelus bactrianus]|uniref:Uncharacterized protein LOC141575847 n=1 Tax=Camelus bactrianus TaxID=9837 RepID=A0AC58PSM1_CAMBA
MYELKNPRSKLFEAKWVSPGDIDLSSVQLQTFTVDSQKVAAFSSQDLMRRVKNTSMTKISTMKQITTPAPKPATTHKPAAKTRQPAARTHKPAAATHKPAARTHKSKSTPRRLPATTPKLASTTRTTARTHTISTNYSKPTPHTIFTNHTTSTNHSKPTPRTTARTSARTSATAQTTANSLANTAFLGPIRYAIQLLLVFFTSKLLF